MDDKKHIFTNIIETKKEKITMKKSSRVEDISEIRKEIQEIKRIYNTDYYVKNLLSKL